MRDRLDRKPGRRAQQQPMACLYVPHCTTRNRVIHDRFPVTYLETVTNIVLSVTFIVFPSWFGRTGYPAHLVMTVVDKQSLINVTD